MSDTLAFGRFMSAIPQFSLSYIDIRGATLQCTICKRVEEADTVNILEAYREFHHSGWLDDCYLDDDGKEQIGMLCMDCGVLHAI